MWIMMMTDSDDGMQYDSQQPEWMDLLQPMADHDDHTVFK